MCWSKEMKDTLASVGILLIRLFVGFGMAAHGYMKFFGEGGVSGFAGHLEKMSFPMPTVMAYASAGSELICGVLIAIGLFTRLAAIPLVINMLVASFVVHGKVYFLPKGMEYALNLAAVYAGIALIGPGKFSVDHYLCKVRSAHAETPGGAK